MIPPPCIDVEVEDEAWTDALPDVEAVVERAAEAALEPSPPLRGRGQGEGGASATLRGWRSSTAACVGRTPTPTPPRKGEGLTLLLTDDPTIQDLNARFRGKDAPTNVLSFPAPESAHPHLGDIALAYGVCASEAEAQGKPLAHHLMHLTVHGVLHLLGYDHEADAEAEEMEGVERAILAALGVPDPYAHPKDGANQANA